MKLFTFLAIIFCTAIIYAPEKYQGALTILALHLKTENKDSSGMRNSHNTYSDEQTYGIYDLKDCLLYLACTKSTQIDELCSQFKTGELVEVDGEKLEYFFDSSQKFAHIFHRKG